MSSADVLTPEIMNQDSHMNGENRPVVLAISNVFFRPWHASFTHKLKVYDIFGPWYIFLLKSRIHSWLELPVF